MKKILVLTLLFTLLVFGSVCAEKATSYTTVSDIKVTQEFNVPKNVEGVIYYIPIYLKIAGKALTEDGGEKTVTVTSEVGTLTETEKTPNEIYTLLGVGYLQEAYADFYIQALSEDVKE